MDCREARRRISAKLDGELNPRRLAPLEAHLAECPECASAAGRWESLRAAFAEVPAPRSRVKIADRVVERIGAAKEGIRSTTVFFRTVAAAAAILLIVTSATIFLTLPSSADAGSDADLTNAACVDRMLSELVRDPALIRSPEEVDR